MILATRFLLVCSCLASCVSKDSTSKDSPSDDSTSTSAVNKVGPQAFPMAMSSRLQPTQTLLTFPCSAQSMNTGRLFVFESTGDKYNETHEAIDNPQFRINLLTDSNADGRYDKSTIYADKVGFPQGGVFYKGSLYASSAPDLIKFTDTDNDGVADKREVILSGWILNVNANSLVGPSLVTRRMVLYEQCHHGIRCKDKGRPKIERRNCKNPGAFARMAPGWNGYRRAG